MFREFVDNKIKKETEQFDGRESLTKEIIVKSGVSDFTKNYLNYYYSEDTGADEIRSMIVKSNKLYFNYALRPKWTLINFLFNNFESRSPAEILKKLSLFPFYKYYTDAVSDFINDNSMIFITKTEIEKIIDVTNDAIYKKLTVDISGEKIKNVLLQLFILNDFAEDKYNLESVIPFSFLKIFLADKNYVELISKFNVISDIKDDDNIELKDIIKVLSGKYYSSEPVEKEKVYPASENSSANPVSEKVKIPVDIEIPEKKEISAGEIERTTEKIIDEQDNNDSGSFKIKKTIVNNDIIKTAADQESVKKEGKVSPVERSGDSDETLKKTESREKSGSEMIKAPVQEKPLTVIDKPVKSGIDFKELFSEKELESILSKVYNSNLISRQRSFDKLNNYKTWFEAFNHLKEVFKNNKVDIYNKDVLKFVDVLNDHFQDKE
ncbi:MAG: hypothetical protein JSS91_10700 [Bacteroidetes bacterium]|nr:hypothetical protein [Bacteroidota bacterium]